MRQLKELANRIVETYAAARSIAVNYTELEKMKAKFDKSNKTANKK